MKYWAALKTSCYNNVVSLEAGTGFCVSFVKQVNMAVGVEFQTVSYGGEEREMNPASLYMKMVF